MSLLDIMKTAYKDNTELEINGDIGDLISWPDFLQNCKDRSFIDYDGHGNWATETEHGKSIIYPSEVLKGLITKPDWATHVMWYNR